MEARVALLGPVRFDINSSSVVPAAMKARQLLALLLLNRGHIVRTATIERELWDEPPRNSLNAIQNCVLQIRRRLSAALGEPSGGPRAKQLLSTAPMGYLLAVPAEWFDLQRYRKLVAEAGAAASTGQLPRSAGLLNAALELWQGAPLADVVAGPVLEAEIVRLLEENKSDRIRRIVLDLRLQRHAGLIGELRALTTMDGYDESLHAYLMFALHMTGRRNAALSVYQDLRQRLVEDLGLEPSHLVKHLHRKIMIDSRRDPVRLNDIPWHSSGLAEAGATVA